MNKHKADNNESKMHLDAMLYLLEDPSLDRNAFENQLAEDTSLAEILAEAVTVYESLRRVDSWQTLPESQLVDIAPLRPTPNPRVWQMVTVLAASFLIAAFLGWNLIQSVRPNTSEIALAWGEMKFDSVDSSVTREASENDFDVASSFSAIEQMAVGDVPEWLVLATADTLDGTLESPEGRARIQ